MGDTHTCTSVGMCSACVQGSQLQELLKLLPPAATELRVELCSCFWARLTDRAKTWSDVMRALTAEQQVCVGGKSCCSGVARLAPSSFPDDA